MAVEYCLFNFFYFFTLVICSSAITSVFHLIQTINCCILSFNSKRDGFMSRNIRLLRSTIHLLLLQSFPLQHQSVQVILYSLYFVIILIKRAVFFLNIEKAPFNRFDSFFRGKKFPLGNKHSRIVYSFLVKCNELIPFVEVHFILRSSYKLQRINY